MTIERECMGKGLKELRKIPYSLTCLSEKKNLSLIYTGEKTVTQRKNEYILYNEKSSALFPPLS